VLGFSSAGAGPTLTVRKGGKSVAVSAGGDTGVNVDSAGFGFIMGAFPGINGFVASKGGQALAGLGSNGDDKYKVAVYNSGSPLFIAGNNGHSTGLFVHDQSGKEIANIESTGATGGRLQLLGPGGKEVASLGTGEDGGDGGVLALEKGGDKVTLGYSAAEGAGLAFNEGGEAIFSVKKDGDGSRLTLGKSDRSIMMKTSGGEAVAIAKAGSRTTEMGVTQKSTGFVIGDSAKPLAALADNGDNKPFMRIYENGGGKAILSAGYESNGKPAFRLGDPSKPLALLQESAKSAGELNLYGPGGGELAVNLGVGDSGAAGLRLSSGGHEGAVLAAKPDGGGAMRIYDGGNTAASVETDGGNAAISVFAGGKERASLVNRGGTGAVVLWSTSGNPLVRLVNSGNGGSMVVSDSGGGDVLEARADPSVGGLVCVNYKNVQKCLGQGLTGMEGFH
jgi:hypothetical protein